MKVRYGNRQLQRASETYAEAIRAFGTDRGSKYIQRINVFQSTDRFSDLFGHRALRFHQLAGARRGTYSARLTANWRLLLEKVGETEVLITGVEDYHGG